MTVHVTALSKWATGPCPWPAFKCSLWLLAGSAMMEWKGSWCSRLMLMAGATTTVRESTWEILLPPPVACVPPSIALTGRICTACLHPVSLAVLSIWLMGFPLGSVL